jgi:hypothetical protein
MVSVQTVRGREELFCERGEPARIEKFGQDMGKPMEGF